MVWRIDGPQGDESSKIRWDLVPYTRGRVLDLGCGPNKTFPHFIGVDSMKDTSLFGIRMKPDLVVPDCTKMDLIASQSVDAVFSSHLLEHIQDHAAALKEWWRLIKPGGYLCLYLPHCDLYPRIGTEGSNPDHKHDFHPDDIIKAMSDIEGWDLLVNETRDQGDEYSFFQVYKKLSSKWVKHSWKDPKPPKTVAVVRYGAFGDAIQASSILPWLKDNGYHVTFYMADISYSVMKNDPHVDRFIVQDRDQVPNMFLGEFWQNEMKKYDKWINLTGTVEDTLLPGPDSVGHKWPLATRRRYMNRNYLEFTHEVAEVPPPYRPKFYPTEDERAWARKQREKMPGRCILWSLAGSSVHKTWPHLDSIVARVMLEMRDTTIVMVGDEACKILETGWENEKRVWRRSGVWNIRQSMTFCEFADLIIGTETGLLNAAGMLDVPKIVTLSHSSVENLTKHWKNAISLMPSTKDVDCYPCHRLHIASSHGDAWTYCRKHETGTADCQYHIHPETMWHAVKESLEWRVQAA